jgi:hypothetical protein
MVFVMANLCYECVHQGQGGFGKTVNDLERDAFCREAGFDHQKPQNACLGPLRGKTKAQVNQCLGLAQEARYFAAGKCKAKGGTVAHRIPFT